jgi:hypothetical protein
VREPIVVPVVVVVAPSAGATTNAVANPAARAATSDRRRASRFPITTISYRSAHEALHAADLRLNFMGSYVQDKYQQGAKVRQWVVPRT